jgi:hypothetical protein
MKELIEKIKNTISSHKQALKDRGEDELGDLYSLAYLEILKELEKQENKPFNPIECGFTLEFTKEGQKEYFLSYKDGHYKLDFDPYKNFYRLSTYIKHKPEFAYLGYPSPYKHYVTIKIPSHRFGVELLKNLGVIE